MKQMVYKIKKSKEKEHKVEEIYLTKSQIEELNRKPQDPNFMGTYLEIEKVDGTFVPKK
jgi:hypothetical protein